MSSEQFVNPQVFAPAPEFDPRAYLAILRRRRLQLVLPAIAVFAIGCAVSFLIPPVYRASATILVESQQIPTDLAQSTITANASERIQLIRQRLMTRDNLLEIVRKFDLFPEQRRRVSPTEIVDWMREAALIEQIGVEGRSNSRPEAQAIGFTISFDYVSATVASSVANEFVTLILQQNLQSRTERAGQTRRFFEQQVARLEAELADQERRIVEFKEANEAALPESLSYRRALLSQLQTQILDLDRRIDLTSDPRSIENDSDQGELLRRRLVASEDQLASVRDELESLAPLAERGVIPRNRIRELERRVAALGSDVDFMRTQSAEFEVRSRERSLQADHLKTQRDAVAGQISALEISIAKTPGVESTLTALTGGYENTRVEHREAKVKLAEAATGAQLEEDRQSERFEVIEQATPPSEPVRPNRPMIIAGGLFAAAVVSGGFVALLETMNRAIYTSADLQTRLGIRPISVIPYVTTVAERRRRRVAPRILLLGLAFGAVAALLAVHIFYLPLDFVAMKIWQRLPGLGVW